LITIFIGYDTRETVAFHVCANSIIRHATKPVSIVPLALNLLNDYSETHIDGSNSFTYSRFLVPHLMNYQGHAVYLDGDMIVLEDISNLYMLASQSYAVQVVKHNYISTHTTKYLGAKNENYPRKNWSSVIVWNCAHATNRQLTPKYIEKHTGAHLHRFSWLQETEIGELPIEWNWLPDELGVNTQAKLLHYTLGMPCFDEFSKVPQADLWQQERQLTMHHAQLA
jgi:lipopolysaccharide biosynthesis glycosyltransferase